MLLKKINRFRSLLQFYLFHCDDDRYNFPQWFWWANMGSISGASGTYMNSEWIVVQIVWIIPSV